MRSSFSRLRTPSFIPTLPRFPPSTKSLCTPSCNVTPPPLSRSPHIPVLLPQILSHFPSPHTVIDCTLGAGGHAEAFLRTYDTISTYIGIDQDPSALSLARTRLSSYPQVQYIHGNFRHLSSLLPSLSHPPDAILLDVGVSSMQLDQAERGFSFMRDGPLDMRMDTTKGPSAYDIVNGASEEVLRRILWTYGEERAAGRIARVICERRTKGFIKSTRELAEIVSTVKKRRGKVHPATLTFQAVRIAVNEELRALEEGLKQAVDVVGMGGRVGVVCFHSLEDRIAKGVFREFKDCGIVQLVTKKPVFVDEGEGNVRARSARLRVVTKVQGGEGTLDKVDGHSF